MASCSSHYSFISVTVLSKTTNLLLLAPCSRNVYLYHVNVEGSIYNQNYFSLSQMPEYPIISQDTFFPPLVFLPLFHLRFLLTAQKESSSHCMDPTPDPHHFPYSHDIDLLHLPFLFGVTREQ